MDLTQIPETASANPRGRDTGRANVEHGGIGGDGFASLFAAEASAGQNRAPGQRSAYSGNGSAKKMTGSAANAPGHEDAKAAGKSKSPREASSEAAGANPAHGEGKLTSDIPAAPSEVAGRALAPEVKGAASTPQGKGHRDIGTRVVGAGGATREAQDASKGGSGTADEQSGRADQFAEVPRGASIKKADATTSGGAANLTGSPASIGSDPEVSAARGDVVRDGYDAARASQRTSAQHIAAATAATATSLSQADAAATAQDPRQIQDQAKAANSHALPRAELLEVRPRDGEARSRPALAQMDLAAEAASKAGSADDRMRQLAASMPKPSQSWALATADRRAMILPQAGPQSDPLLQTVVASTGPAPGQAPKPWASMPPASAPSGPERGALPQIVAAVTARSNGGVIELMLEPPELGRIEIVIDLGEQGLRATLSAERQSTGDMLRRQGDLLMQQLEEAGFSDVDLGFGSQEDPRDEHGSHLARQRSSAGAGEADEVAAPAKRLSMRFSDRQMDMRL